jgi:tRNA (guanine6-N2)-methyltransferase
VKLATAADREDGPLIIARSVHGLEWVCAAEVRSVPGLRGGTALSRRQVEFAVASVGPELLGLRTADDVFLKLAAVDGPGPAKAALPIFARNVARLDWQPALLHLRALRDVPERGSFDVVASIEGHRGFNRFAVEHCLGVELAPVLGAAFLERDREGRPGPDADLTVRVFVHRGYSTVALRLGSRPLHRRSYKSQTGAGTLHPPVAAALAAIAAPDAGVVLDPFCGDGTIAIEVALAHRTLTVVASDMDLVRVANTEANARQAGVDIDVRLAEAATVAERINDVAAVITNPPWNKAVTVSGRARAAEEDFWRLLARALRPAGVVCCLTDTDLDLPGTVSRLDWQVGLVQRIRLAGRLADMLLAAPPGRSTPRLSAELAGRREEALASGVITRTGF